jgi:hypothetical protein
VIRHVPQVLRNCFVFKKVEESQSTQRQGVKRIVEQLGGRSRPYFFWSVERSESRIAQEAASTGREKIASQSRRTQAERSQKKYSRKVPKAFGMVLFGGKKNER